MSHTVLHRLLPLLLHPLFANVHIAYAISDQPELHCHSSARRGVQSIKTSDYTERYNAKVTLDQIHDLVVGRRAILGQPCVQRESALLVEERGYEEAGDVAAAAVDVETDEVVAQFKDVLDFLVGRRVTWYYVVYLPEVVDLVEHLDELGLVEEEHSKFYSCLNKKERY